MLIQQISYRLPHNLRRNLHKLLSPKKHKQIQKRRLKSDDDYSLYEYDRFKCIFIHIPKTGGISVNESLFNSRGGAHKTAMHYKLVYSKNEFDNYFKFTFVRNPWTRLYSAYKFLKEGGINDSDEKFAQKHLSSYASFEDFVLNGLDKSEILNFRHFIPQSSFITNPVTKQVLVNFIGLFENFEADFNYIANHMNVEANLLFLNKTKSSKKSDMKSVYSNEMSQVVEKVYKEDIELLKYEIEDDVQKLINNRNQLIIR